MTHVDGLRLRTAVACWAAVFVSLLLELQEPWWAAISAFIVSHSDRKTIVTKSLLRVIGTIIGSVLAFYVATQFAGQDFLVVALMAISVMAGIYKRYTSRYAYAWVLGSITGVLVAYVSLATPGETREFAINRGMEIIVGVLTTMVIELLFNLHPKEEKSSFGPGSVDEDTRRHAMEAGVFGGFVLVVIVLLDKLFGLPSPVQIIITSLVMIQLRIGFTHEMAYHRLFGCLLGGVSGLAVVYFLPSNFVVWSVFLLFGIFTFSGLHFSGDRHAYVGTQSVIAFLMTMITGNGPPSSIAPVLDRLAGILIGVIILVIGNLLAADLGFGRDAAKKAETGK
ncbi:FUSC family protein [Roseibium sp. RKSG952]|uniref:FUSC family protein n=1 Tax=Roseibium sp. RKSG952 TaxID=2529384 RepID=UPI0012BC1AB0|nr:FUSC family protein [Roseibium sp. RKSG952]MTH97641.1 FUSC family protein [Roseibium sp. RKSG952]